MITVRVVTWVLLVVLNEVLILRILIFLLFAFRGRYFLIRTPVHEKVKSSVCLSHDFGKQKRWNVVRLFMLKKDSVIAF